MPRVILSNFKVEKLWDKNKRQSYYSNVTFVVVGLLMTVNHNNTDDGGDEDEETL